MGNLDDLVTEFLVESYENLDRLDRLLVELEKDPRDQANLASIFRTIHTIKGTCGFLGYSRLEAVTHVGENLLSRLRDGELVLDAPMTSGLLHLIDGVRGILQAIEQTGAEPDTDFTALIAELEHLNAGTSPAATAEAASVPEATVVAAVTAAIEPVIAPAPADDRASGEGPAAADHGRQGLADTSLRVDVGLLDKLMNLVGELVLARNQILQFTATQSDTAFVGATQRLNLVASELQEGVMKTRMQPIGNVWSKFPRVVRDLATTCGKQVRIEMVGKDTDLDKTIIEAIKDPLTHVVRNSVDHGIEPAAERLARGKSPEGRLLLRAFHEGGQINIEIADDGAGIDPERVKRKAIERGLITAEHAARMGDHEATRLIFLPGFSTAEKVTNVSGRGVGMDVVKTNIEKIGGTVDIASRVGEGTTLKVKIPLTLAIIPALMVSTGRESYAIPQVNLLELVRLEGEQARSGIERVQSALFYRLRGNLLPLVYLHRELALEAQAGPDLVNIVVLKADDRQFGLVVDQINDTEEIVVKPLGKALKGVRVFAGATIMGDGHVALILDVLGIAQQAGVVSEVRAGVGACASGAAARGEAEPAETWLLFRVDGHERMAMPLHLVDRLEEFPQGVIERSARQEVVQYRGEIMPLVSLAEMLGAGAGAAADPRQVIVFAGEGRRIGLVVDRILDIATEAIAVTPTGRHPGIHGSAVIQQRVTDLLDVPSLVRLTAGPAAAAGAAA
ncbi:MAG: chemotaxis protein CheA [Vicinamibacterales bacterium]|nr:chemotaxis protein CheA [Vicinamibacterales bacterium]